MIKVTFAVRCPSTNTALLVDEGASQMNKVIETFGNWSQIVHQLDTCEESNTKFCDVGYFLLTLSFLLVLIIFALMTRVCTQR